MQEKILAGLFSFLQGAFDCPKVYQFTWGFFAVLGMTAPRYTRKSSPCHLVFLSSYGEGVDGLLPFSPTVFLV